MDIPPLNVQVRGTRAFFIPLMPRIGLLKSHSADHAIRYTAPFTLQKTRNRLPHRVGFFRERDTFPWTFFVPDSGACK